MFQTQSTIAKVQTLSDNTIRLTVDCQELRPNEEALLFQLRNRLGWFLFNESPIKPEDVELPEFVPEFKDDKSPAKRLRSVFYVFWNERTAKKDTFEDFYRRQMEKIIERVKQELD